MDTTELPVFSPALDQGADALVQAAEKGMALESALPTSPAPKDLPAPLKALPASSDLQSPDLYLNRELAWLEFNQRVLHEAADRRTPLLERVKFAAIAGSNLDEFFMKRIGGLKQQVGAGVQERTVDGRTPEEQIGACYAFIRKHQLEKQRLLKILVRKLREKDIQILPYEKLEKSEREKIREDYYDNIFPLVTPQSIDPAHPFPFVSNLSLNLLVTLRYPKDREISMARVKAPISAGAPRFLRIGRQNRFVLLEEVMEHNLDMLFPGMEILHCDLFRVTRNANTERAEEHADDLLALIESTLQQRKFAPIVRLEVLPGMDSTLRGRLAAELGLDEEADVFIVDGMLGTRDLFEIAALNLPQLKEVPQYPIIHPALQSERSIFHLIRDAGAILLQHPYESFSTSVERLLREAAHDPKVRGIKMTLYRTSSRSPILDYLIQAAQNGKQVAVVVELKARFDEAANIRLASRLEEAGIHVTYGVVGLKTHAKIILVVRNDYNGLRRYVHIGTGNYHPETSRLYSDLGLLLYDKNIGRDATELFNYLTTGFTPSRRYQKLLVAPKMLKRGLLERIDREIAGHAEKSPGRIIFKMNALDDADIARALYRAARAGVRIDLIIRDSCRVRPGIAGLSENIRVISIVGRFLEHARIYYFRNGGEEEYFIGSADAMKRNLEHRVEVLTPVENPAIRADLRQMLEIQLNDRRSAWELNSDGGYSQRRPRNAEEGVGSQQRLIEQAERRNRDASRLRKRKAKNIGGRNLR
ncbi:polyphosphate kinase 1 [Trichloromonas sp.]|uniref:polyphosphate kinase 1 n=1 Tax=Trichloromonas sp. TaxID=3069249 RepID=UPI002A37570D|nr:polyphosphate kinase 1 [Trichloromonas sp.]